MLLISGEGRVLFMFFLTEVDFFQMQKWIWNKITDRLNSSVDLTDTDREIIQYGKEKALLMNCIDLQTCMMCEQRLSDIQQNLFCHADVEGLRLEPVLFVTCFLFVAKSLQSSKDSSTLLAFLLPCAVSVQ